VPGAEVEPQQGMIAFVEDGSIPFDNAENGQCMMRIQRTGIWLLIEDNQQCGGSMVTSAGLTGATIPGTRKREKPQLSQR